LIFQSGSIVEKLDDGSRIASSVEGAQPAHPVDSLGTNDKDEGPRRPTF